MKEIYMKYIESNLLQGEKIEIEAKASWFARPFLLLVAIFAGLMGFGSALAMLEGKGESSQGYVMLFSVCIFTYIYFEIKSIELAVTNKRVISKFGLISRKTIELSLNRVESVQIRQSIIGRILGYGSVVISGAGNPQAPIPGISNPNQFKNQLNALIHSNKS